MTKTETFKSAMARLEKVLTARPSEGQNTKTVTAELGDGLQCKISDGQFTVVSDQPPTVWGGDNTGPTPGFLARAGIAACLAQGYALFFAHRDIPFERLSVEVQSDTNASSVFGADGVTPGFQELRHIINVESSADPAAIQAAIDETEAGSIVLQSFARAVACKGEVRLNQYQEAAE